jgi:hypothetical protein
MPFPSNAIPITGPVGLNSSAEVHSTHLDSLGKGGFRAVATTAEMNAITVERRSWGMMVYVREVDEYYKLSNTQEGGASDNLNDNNNWEVVTMGGTEGPQGPQGEPGPTGPTGPAIPGNLNFVGYYDSQESYVLGDVAMYPPNGTPTSNPPVASYVVMTATATGAPLNQDGSINTAGGWAFFATAGPAGVNGATGPMGPQGNQGEAGQDGDTGANGAKWFTGITTPDLAELTGVNDGDYYLHLPEGGNTEAGNGDVYVYENGDWVDAPVGNIQGPDGADGGGEWPFTETITTASIGGTNGFSSPGFNVSGMTAFEILKQLLFPYISPSLSNFNVYSNSAGTNLESVNVPIGTQLSGIKYFKVTTGTPTNFAPNTFKISQEQSLQSGAQIIYGSVSAPIPTSNQPFVTAAGSEISINSVGFTTAGSFVRWRASASTNQTPAVTVNSNYYTINWRLPVFYGVSTSTSLSPSGVASFPSVLTAQEEGSYAINYSNPNSIQYIYFAYPVSGDAFGTFTNMRKTGVDGSLGLIILAFNGQSDCTSCNDFSTPDGTGKFYKPITINVGPQNIPVDYRLYRSTAAFSEIISITIE